MTGTNDTSIFVGEETAIYVELAGNTVKVPGSGGATEIALSGGGKIIIGNKTFSTSDDFVGILQVNSEGNVYSVENFAGTLSGKLGGIEIAGVTIDSQDSFSVTGDGEKITAIGNLNLENATVISGKENITLSGDDVVVVQDISAEVNITASRDSDTIVSQGKNVHVNLTGGNTQIFPLDGKITLENYDAATDAGFGTTHTNILSAIESGSIDFDDGYLELNSAQVYLGNGSELMNFYNMVGKQQKVGYASSKDSLDVRNETDDLILVAKKNATVTSGSGYDTILANENSFVDGGNGKNQIYLTDYDSRRSKGGATVVSADKGTTDKRRLFELFAKHNRKFFGE